MCIHTSSACACVYTRLQHVYVYTHVSHKVYTPVSYKVGAHVPVLLVLRDD